MGAGRLNSSADKGRLYYGWIVLVACAILVIIASGMRFSFGVFFKPLATEFGLGRAVTSEIFSVYMVLSAISMVAAGWALGRYHPRVVFSIIGFFAGLSLLLTSQANDLWHIFISYSLLLAVGTGSVYIQAISLTMKWFDKNRGLAIGIVASGMGTGIMLMTPFSAWLIDSYNWQTSYFLLAFLAFFIMIPLALLLKNAPRKPSLPNVENLNTKNSSVLDKVYYGRSVDFTLRQAARTANFWFIALVRFLLACNVYLVLTHIVPHAIDLGINPIQAASVLSLVGFGTLAGMLVLGKASDIIGKKRTVVICLLVTSLSMLWPIWSSSLCVLYIFAILLGFFQAGAGPAINSLIADVFGTRHIAVINGTLNAFWGIGAAVGPTLAGYIFDISGSYITAFLAGLVAVLISTVIALFLRTSKA
ncbi:MFS transporter [Chloroflexota bacterium]